MSCYSQIYKNKKINENNKFKNKSYNNLNKATANQSNDNKYLQDKLSEKNSSISTFNNFKNVNNQDGELKNLDKIIFNSENNQKNESNVKNTNIKNSAINIIDENKNRIRYRKKIPIKDQIPNKKEIIIENYLEEENNSEENNNKSNKENLKEQIKKEKDKNNETLKSIKSIESEGNNNFIYDMNQINNNKNNYNFNEKSKENEIIEKSSHNSKINEPSIKSEIYNDFICYTNQNNNNHHKLSTIPKNEETFESLNIIKDTNDKLLTKEQILYFTHIIFLNNSQYINNKACYMMTKANLLNILKSLHIIKSQLILVEIDLIYDLISSKNSMISYSQFNQILMKIIQKIYQEQYLISPQLTINYFINKLIKHYNLFFENKIPKDYLYKYQYNSIVKLIQIFPNENQIILISQIILTINEIYEKYFIYELDYSQEYLYKSIENLVKFCRDFEIIPQIINSTQAMTYYNLIIHIEPIYNKFQDVLKKRKISKNKGKIFTLFHFLLFIIHISLYSYTKIFGSKSWNSNNNNISKEEKLLLFLEKLEHSKGMINFLSKLYTPRTKPLSLIPPKDICLALGIFEIEKKKQKITESLDNAFDKERKESRKEKDKLLLEI